MVGPIGLVAITAAALALSIESEIARQREPIDGLASAACPAAVAMAGTVQRRARSAARASRASPDAFSESTWRSSCPARQTPWSLESRKPTTSSLLNRSAIAACAPIGPPSVTQPGDGGRNGTGIIAALDDGRRSSSPSGRRQPNS